MKDDRSLERNKSGKTNDFPVNRREFLKIAGSGIFVFFTLGDALFFRQDIWGREPLPTDFNAFLRISEDGRVSCFTGKIEMGQGIVTSLAQMLADELDVNLESVDMVMGDTDLCPWDMGTFGSMSTRFFGPPLRAAGAEARRVLLELAAEHLKTPLDQLTVENGVVFDMTNRDKNTSYGLLAEGKKIERHLTERVDVKRPHQFKIMNKPVTRQDALEKVTGQAKFAGDIRVPGMLYAKILRPPAHDAGLVNVDLLRARQVEGVQIVREGDFIAVLHKYPDVAELALSRINAAFDKPESNLDETTIFDHLLKKAPSGQSILNSGDLKKGQTASATLFEKTYLDGYVAHAPIEPHTAVVKIEGNDCTVWASTQTPFGAKDEVARTIGFPVERVRIITPYVGGGFGGKTRNLQVVEAARLAKLSGKPVQVAWSRQEEFFNDSFRPAAVVKIKSGITDQGRISLWDYHVYFAGQRGSEHFYDIPNHRTTVYGSGWRGIPGSHPFATGAWRAPGNNTNTFARESQIDIMAAGANMDPLAFRLQHLTDEKMQHVLRVAAETFGWKSGKTPSGRGYGIACGTDAGTYVATMAEVDVDQDTGEVKVKRVVCAQDMGLAINPEGATIQMEGCITMGLGYALKEDIHFKGGEIFDLSFETYEIPRFSWLPEIETVIIDNKDAPPQGGGEPAIITMGGVIANAIYDAVGARVLQMPMTPDRIKKAISN
jgi:isoquinoline 1-oxidoreductase